MVITYEFKNKKTANINIRIYANSKELALDILGTQVKNPDNFKLLNNF